MRENLKKKTEIGFKPGSRLSHFFRVLVHFRSDFRLQVCNCCSRLHDFFAILASQSSNSLVIRTAKFLENLMCSENYICTLFESKADSNLKEI